MTEDRWLSGLRAALDVPSVAIDVDREFRVVARLDLQALTAINFLALQVGRLADQLEKMNGPEAQT
jgi:hypothetical protein